MSTPANPTIAEPSIDASLVNSLLRTLIPQTQAIELQERHEGKDYLVWRFGHDWAIRLPKRQLAADRQSTEVQWLAAIGSAWTFRAPIPVRVVGPSAAYPWAWSVVPWIAAPDAATAPLSPRGAAELGNALHAIHVTAPHSAPKHPVKSQPLSVRAGRIADRIATLYRRTETGPWRFDAKAAQRTLDTGIAQPRPELTWAHLDLRAPHILTHQGSLVGIIDWGDAAAGDPATDIGHALATLPHSHWDALVQGYGGLSLGDFQRARAEALDMASWLALSHDPVEARSGWAALQSLGLAKTA